MSVGIWLHQLGIVPLRLAEGLVAGGLAGRTSGRVPALW
jgi:hypothetical protein